MKFITLSQITFFSLFLALGFSSPASAQEVVSQSVALEKGWNIVSTPMVLDSHEFSVAETADNFDIYLLDPAQPTGWATMADLGQTEFTPLFGYFINNKTGLDQTLTFMYASGTPPNEKLFQRTFEQEGWYSIGVANDEYAKDQSSDRIDTNNPSKILSLMSGNYDMVIDFTDAVYDTNRRSVAVGDAWKGVAPSDVDTINDLRETKGYAVYIKEAGTKYNGFQNEPQVTSVANVEEELISVESSDDPDGTTLMLNDDSKSDWYTVFIFNFDSGSSDDPMTITSIPVQLTLSTSTYEEVLDDAELVVNGSVYNNVAVSDLDNSNPTLTFDLGDGAVLYPGEQLEVELRLRFNALDPERKFMTIQSGLVNVDAVVAEGLDGVLNADQLKGSVVGNEHALMTDGIFADSFYFNEDTTGDNDQNGVFTIEFEVTAFENDFYIPNDSGVNFTVEGGLATTSYSLTSTADEDNSGVFSVNDGETETFTLKVIVDPQEVGAYRVVVESINYSDNNDGVTDIQTLFLLPESDYRTDYLFINSD